MRILSFPFADKHCGQRRYYAPAAPKLLARFLEDAVYEFQVAAYHPLRRPLYIRPAVELECGPDSYHHPAFQVWLEHAHEYLLLRSSESHPDDLSPVPENGLCDGRVVEVLYVAVGKGDELHRGHIRIDLSQTLLEAFQSRRRCAHEYHPVLARADDVHEDLAAAVLPRPEAVYPFDIQRHETAVTDGEHTAVHHLAVLPVALDPVEDHPVRHTDVAGLTAADLPVDFLCRV